MHYPLQEAVSIPQSTLSGSPPVDSSPVLQHPYERPQTEYATLEHWLYLLQKTAWLLREKCIRYHQYPINMLNLFGRRRKLCEMGFQIRNAWVYLMLALGQSLSEKQARVALNTTNNISKLAVATGQGDFEGLHIDDAEQLFMQGEKHFLGFGVPRCFETALKRYQAAANLGLSAAYTMLGTFNEFGIGMTVNMAAAIKHYETAATKGNSDAIFQLGKLSEHGKGLEQNYKNAHEYYKKASDLRHVESLARLGTLVEHGNGCEQNQKHAVEIYRTAANQGSARAQTSLGSCFYSGNGTRRDRFEAVIWFKKAADQGHAPAQYNLGVCYEQGHGFAKDLAMAKIMYKQAADHKHPAATCSLGYMYLAEGQFLDAINTLHIAISLGNNEALFHLGTLYESGCSDSDGLVLSQDLDMALRYYEQASKKVFLTNIAYHSSEYSHRIHFGLRSRPIAQHETCY